MGKARIAALAAARALHLLPAIEAARMRATAWRAAGARRSLEAQYGPLPPAELLYETTGAVNWGVYWQTGRETAAYLAEAIRDSLPGSGPRCALEWGCGPGRIARHMRAALGPAWVLAATDVDARAIAWCRDNVPGVAFSANDLLPPLAYGAASFDAVYCVSVMTHLDTSTQRAWVAEVARVLRPGAVFLASFHSDKARGYLSGRERTAFDAGTPVVRGSVREGSRTFLAYHSPRAVAALLTPAFEDVRELPDPRGLLGAQTLVAARRAPGG
jgi:SAM-dependent methyltransferase